MSIFGRMADIFKANINELIDKAEDPATMMDQMVREMQEQLREAKIQVAKAIADEKKLHHQLKQNEMQAKNWESKAVLALKKGDERLAKEALKQKKTYDNLASSVQTQWEEQNALSSKLKDNLRALESKIDEARRKKEILIARQKRAEAQKKIHDVMSGLNDTSAFATFDRMEQKVLEIEAQADAAVELEVESLDDQFKALESSSEVDDELAALKAKLSLNP
ncbi:PspA/IM30 family protein [candidate division KSB3 bacterium]|uniref:PspA/IM30 family protein n=1 Tax=candidate division KSB3 bacterium TaxID=2044937 RepID=A0A9D5JY42_9BACT|nr:PspA/IM30 family protein [candidate division KSB3 bacterium]MBD3326378.1 PspA/IM30 family protein [candidate division KSB3 bacterium]